MWQTTVLLSFLGKFLTISIKILKNQRLSLTLGKATSPYGRLLCCLYDEGGFYQ
ncbi:Signal peptidase-like protein [Streptococcus pyogenes MGAS10750]|nr:Signal peptidase-like protein [Streptococcus pyogenes MGAS10750]